MLSEWMVASAVRICLAMERMVGMEKKEGFLRYATKRLSLSRSV